MYHIIINPASKSGRGRKIWENLEPVLVEKKISYHVTFSKRAGHVSHCVRELTLSPTGDGKSVQLIVLGGDGTLNEVLQGIVDFDKVELGYIPTGSSNDMARDLELPKNPRDILEIILSGRTHRTVDIGQVIYDSIPEETNDRIDTKATDRTDKKVTEQIDKKATDRTDKKITEQIDKKATDRTDKKITEQIDKKATDGKPSGRYFAVSCGIGFDAAVCEEALTSPFKNILNKIGLGKLIYLAIALKQIITAPKVACNIYLDNGEPIHYKKFLFMASMIHKYEGGGFKFCPDADATDGLVDVCIVGGLPKPILLMILPTAFWGKHLMFPRVDGYRCSSVRIETSAPLWVHTDGETEQLSRAVTMTCHKKKLHLLV